ncbi:MAG: hypothetical protein KQJ78_14675 [Deltaproteobacteria bacterium]|nr:hypothetical protein [Deltaproteobacteria bacterium]
MTNLAPSPQLPWVCRHDPRVRMFQKKSCRPKQEKLQEQQGKPGWVPTNFNLACVACDGPAWDDAKHPVAPEGETLVTVPADRPYAPACPICGKPQRLRKDGVPMGYCPEHWRQKVAFCHKPEEQLPPEDSAPAAPAPPPEAAVPGPDPEPEGAAMDQTTPHGDCHRPASLTPCREDAPPEAAESRAAPPAEMEAHPTSGAANGVTGRRDGHPQAPPPEEPPACPDCGQPQAQDKLGRYRGFCRACEARRRRDLARAPRDYAAQVALGRLASNAAANLQAALAGLDPALVAVQVQGLLLVQILDQAAGLGCLPGWRPEAAESAHARA